MTYEKVADDLEQASHLQEQLNMAGRKVCAKAAGPQTPIGADGEHMVRTQCIECEDPLPQVRIEYKWVRCTPCQIEADRLKKLGR